MSRHVISPLFYLPLPFATPLYHRQPPRFLLPIDPSRHHLSPRLPHLPLPLALSHLSVDANSPWATPVSRPADQQRPEPRLERVGRRGWFRPARGDGWDEIARVVDGLLPRRCAGG